MCDNKISNDKNEQKEFYQSCLGGTCSEINIGLMLFAIKRFNLSKDLLIDVIKQTKNKKTENLRCAVTNVIKELIDVMDETEKLNENWEENENKQLRNYTRGNIR